MSRVETGVAIHGGAGTIRKDRMTPEMEAAYRSTLAESLRAGRTVLDGGGSALDGVVASVRVMEDSELFNAGRGSNLDERGVATMDAAIMDGPTGNAGAVADVSGVRYPVELARRVMEDPDHVFLVGEGAEAFARRHGLRFEPLDFFVTERRKRAMERARDRADERPNVLGDPGEPDSDTPASASGMLEEKSGTVGAVARDASGHVAAATSTGGMANKPRGRVGDSPVIGAGTWASDACAVSCTGWGEYFIRAGTAHEVHARMTLAGSSLAEAAHAAIWETLESKIKGAGGLVAIDTDGHVQFSFSSSGMYRGWIGDEGVARVGIWDEELAPESR